MEGYLTLTLSALLPVLLAAAFLFFERKTPFSRAPFWLRQGIYGASFGALAVLATEFGPHIGGIVVNCRDAGVITAGLLFGGPAGILAGIIGGVERWFCVLWGGGMFSRTACTVATVAAGIYAALMRRFLFEEKCPSPVLSFLIGIVIETFHLTMIFLTHLSEPREVLAAIRAGVLPMLLFNAVSLLLAALIGRAFLPKEEKRGGRSGIARQMQRRLLIAVLLAFAVTSGFVYTMQTRIARQQTEDSLTAAVGEVTADIRRGSGSELSAPVQGLTENRALGRAGCVLILDADGRAVSCPAGFPAAVFAKALSQEERTEGEVFPLTVGSDGYLCCLGEAEGYSVVSLLPAAEATETRDLAVYVNTFMEILVFGLLFVVLFLLIRRRVISPLREVNGVLSRITEGDLTRQVEVRPSAEFDSLSDGINATLSALQRFGEEREEQLRREMKLAKDIQTAALPSVQQAFPGRDEFDLYAAMRPAKEVGGDFYDFYLGQDGRLNFLIADVSGKGVPAALLMMRVKAELKGMIEKGMPANRSFTQCNASLTGDDDTGMFVTAWQGGLDTETGEVLFVNGGHNPPLVRHNGRFEYLRTQGFVLGGTEGTRYRMQTLTLSEGDVIFLYTDGVTEAMNAAGEQYGERRLLRLLNSITFTDMKELCKQVRQSVDAFAAGEPQADDITLLALHYIGKREHPSLTLERAVPEDIPSLLKFTEETLVSLDCPGQVRRQYRMAAEEVAGRILSGAYPEGSGFLKTEVFKGTDGYSLRFFYGGEAFNPMEEEREDMRLVNRFLPSEHLYRNRQNVLTFSSRPRSDE